MKVAIVLSLIAAAAIPRGGAAAENETCHVSGRVVTSAPDELVIERANESQNERIRFTRSHGMSRRMQSLSPGTRVTVTFTPNDDNAGVIREILEDPVQSPGEAPKSEPIIDDRAFYEARRGNAGAQAHLG